MFLLSGEKETMEISIMIRNSLIIRKRMLLNCRGHQGKQSVHNLQKIFRPLSYVIAALLEGAGLVAPFEKSLICFYLTLCHIQCCLTNNGVNCVVIFHPSFQVNYARCTALSESTRVST